MKLIWALMILLVSFGQTEAQNNAIDQKRRPSFIATSAYLYSPSDKNRVIGPAFSVNYFHKKKWGLELITASLDEPGAYEIISGIAIDLNFLYPIYKQNIYGKAGFTSAFGGFDEYAHLAGTAFQFGLGYYQTLGKKLTLRVDVHERIWFQGYYIPRRFSTGALLGLGFSF